ncbi:hypothetical protein APL41_gp51 [Lactobacillus phage LBR48]|uniref:Uncharacterized protein n=1 Tax=Lactobacillus phage LBR48 TaxID=755164 RepID=D6PSW5_9CAUD|nr:hypothetical protein APL41_gp51 [Lactobacillus phage LBR48]ADF83456.1 hypothetical protein [Lactobacillus phage LBR48]
MWRRSFKNLIVGLMALAVGILIGWVACLW